MSVLRKSHFSELIPPKYVPLLLLCLGFWDEEMKSLTEPHVHVSASPQDLLVSAHQHCSYKRGPPSLALKWVLGTWAGVPALPVLTQQTLYQLSHLRSPSHEFLKKAWEWKESTEPGRVETWPSLLLQPLRYSTKRETPRELNYKK